MRVKAIVRVTLDIEASSVWTGNTTWNQIAKQAEDDVRGLLLHGNPLTLVNIPPSIKGLEVVQVAVRPEGGK